MEVLIWFSIIPAFLTICKVVKIFFNKLVHKKALEILNHNRSNGHHNGKEKDKGKTKTKDSDAD